MTKYNTFTVYPRVCYFQKRLESLYPRFVNITTYFENEAYHSQQLLDKIKKRFEVYQKPPLFHTQDDTSFDLQTILEDTSTCEEGIEQESYGIEVFICCHKLESRSCESYIDEIDTLVKPDFEMMYKKTGQDLYFFVICHVGDSKILLRKLPNEMIPVSKRGETDFGRSISDILENDICELFCWLYDYLQRFTWHTEAFKRDFQHFEPADISSTISSFANNILALNDLKKIHGIKDDSPGKSKGFVNIAAKKLSREVCQRIIAILTSKFGLTSLVIATMETEFDLHSKLFDCLSECPSVRRDLKYLEKQCSDMYIQEHLKYHSNKIQAKLEDCFDVSNLLNKFMDSAALLEFEKKVQVTLTVVHQMKKMKYEIEQYLDKSVLLMKQRPEARMSKSIALAIQSVNINNSKIVGFRKGDKQNYMSGDIAATEKMMHTTGCQISSRWTNGPDSRGTVGAFMLCSEGHRYALTAAHVVKKGDTMAASVYLQNQDGKNTRIGTPESKFTIDGTVDITAIKISQRLDEKEFQCTMKDLDGEQCAATIFSVNDALQHSMLPCVVYKYGAKTGLREGILLSPLKCILDGGSHMVWIDSLPDFPERKFAEKGDSGALVCFVSPDTQNVSVLAMLTSGELVIRNGKNREIVSYGGFGSVLFHSGLKEIESKSGLRLSFQDPNQAQQIPMDE